MQYGLTNHRAEQVKTMEAANGRTELCAVTGPDYGRICDYELVSAVQRIAGNGVSDTRWKVPGVPDWHLQSDGGAEGRNLEPSDLLRVLEDLEAWSAVLRSDPELSERLTAFAKAQAGGSPIVDQARGDVPAASNLPPEPSP